jgi:hypothetical protein
MWFVIALMVMWFGAGIANLCQERISKVSYGCTWLVVLAFLANKLLESL